MTGRVRDIRLRLALRRECQALAREHPELGEGSEEERLAEWLASDEPDSADERLSRSERRRERPASRDD